MHPLLFLDLETTGLSAEIAAPIAIAAVVLGGPSHDEIFHRFMRPFKGADINPFALAVNGYKEDQIQTWDPPELVCRDFIDWCLERFPAPQLITPAGWNYAFDERFLREWVLRHAPDAAALYGNLFNPQHIETMNVVRGTYPDHAKLFPKKGGMKLTYQYEWHFGAPLDKAHTELADCIATRSIFLRCDQLCSQPSYADYHHLIPPIPGAGVFNETQPTKTECTPPPSPSL